MSSGNWLRPHLSILLINLVTVAFLYAKTPKIDVAAQHQQLAAINELKTISLSLDRSIFQLNIDWLNTYDPIVQDQNRRHQIIRDLVADSGKVASSDRTGMLLSEIMTIAEQSDRMIERIKRSHSQLKNSKAYFPALTDEILTATAAGPGGRDIDGALMGLRDLVAAQSFSPSAAIRNDIERQIERIGDVVRDRTSNDPALSNMIQSLAGHARIIADGTDQLKNLSRGFLRLHYHGLVDQVYERFSNDFVQQQVHAEGVFLLLYGVLLFLVGHVVLLFVQLIRVNGRVLAQASDLEASLFKEKEVNGLQRQFVSMVSHEFRTPLAIIDGHAQRLRKAGNGDPQRLNRISTKIRNSVSRLIDLMESVLSVAELEQGKIKVTRADMDLEALIHEITANYQELNMDRSIKVEVADLPRLFHGDARLLRQVISNLLSNAVKYSEKGSPISLEAAGDGREISIAVKDRGVGIPADEVGNLFQRFYRASSANGVAGTGIGLHLVQHLVGLHGGRLSVHSVLGEGSRFAVHLPIPDASSISGEALGPLATVAAAA